MDYMKLLAASQVYELAQTLHKRDRAQYLGSLKLASDSQMYETKSKEWDVENNIQKYIKTAYRELLATMDLIDEADAEYRYNATEEIAAGVRAGLEKK